MEIIGDNTNDEGINFLNSVLEHIKNELKRRYDEYAE
jgi:hypothetical protein